MNFDNLISEPFLFNPLKHHLGFLREFTHSVTEQNGLDINFINKELSHLGTSVMDMYSGTLKISQISMETEEFLSMNDLFRKKSFCAWADVKDEIHRFITLSDNSQWTLKYNEDQKRFIHIFPSRNSKHTFRIKPNTLKTALLYYMLIGKDLITTKDLNRVRALSGLSPVKNTTDTEAITEMIEILRVPGSLNLPEQNLQGNLL
jgi:hypothetical protein